MDLRSTVGDGLLNQVDISRAVLHQENGFCGFPHKVFFFQFIVPCPCGKKGGCKGECFLSHQTSLPYHGSRVLPSKRGVSCIVSDVLYTKRTQQYRSRVLIAFLP